MSLLADIGPLHQALNYHLARHNLLSANLAHIDTPGYRPVDLYREQSFGEVLQAHLTRTDARHLGIGGRADGWQVQVDRFSPVKPDGNAVSLDREAVKIASNNLRYNAVANMLQSELSMMQFAARDGR